jgi:surface polysaccharide O-acyltransferase-like enzyme
MKAISNQQSAISNQQSAISNQQSAISNQQSAISNQQSAIDTRYLNTLRVFATFAVIMIHVFSPINTYFSNYLAKSESYICIVLNNLWQWCVPIFVMITGVLHLNPEKTITIEKTLKRYVLRILLAIIIFGIPYCFMEIFFDQSLSFNIKQIGVAALNTTQGKSWDHMWYLYMIAGLYLCIPLIKVFVINAQKNIIKYTLVVLFIFTSIIPTLESVIPYKFGIYIPINSVYVFYLLLGYYLHYNKISIKNNVLFALLVFYVLYAIIMPVNRNFVLLSNGGHLKLTDYNSPLVVMVTFAIFCIYHQHNKPLRFIDIIAPMCFGIYLIHPLFINFLYKFIKLSPEKYPLIIVVIITVLVTIILSIIFSYLAQRIRIFKKYVL